MIRKNCYFFSSVLPNSFKNDVLSKAAAKYFWNYDITGCVKTAEEEDNRHKKSLVLIAAANISN